MTKSDNLYILFIIQALLTILLFFAKDYLRYAIIALFFIIDIIIILALMQRSWDSIRGQKKNR